jgi:hypothetical protein
MAGCILWLIRPFPSRSDAMDADEIGILVSETNGIPVVWLQAGPELDSETIEHPLQKLIIDQIHSNVADGEISKSVAFNLRKMLTECLEELDKYTPCDDEEQFGAQEYPPTPAEIAGE